MLQTYFLTLLKESIQQSIPLSKKQRETEMDSGAGGGRTLGLLVLGQEVSL
jgi:hypothetical protein